MCVRARICNYGDTSKLNTHVQNQVERNIHTHSLNIPLCNAHGFSEFVFLFRVSVVLIIQAVVSCRWSWTVKPRDFHLNY